MRIMARVTGGSDRRIRRFLLAGGKLATGAVLAELVLVGPSVPVSAQTLTWSVVPSPNRGAGDFLNGASCVAAAACTAVGYYHNSSGAGKTLIESWDGTSWSVVPSPSPGATVNILNGVSCASAAACTAVGYYKNSSGAGKTLIESWDGTSWSVVRSPSPGATVNILNGVFCVSAAACTAVGYFDDGTLIESWDGTSWSVVPSPSPGNAGNFLNGVSCVAAAACTAVGYYEDSDGINGTLIESWDGTSWSVVPSPSPGSSAGIFDFLHGVSCISVGTCTAAGYYFRGGAARTLIESWNGTSWSVVPSPNPGVHYSDNYLSSVSCVSAAACTAVGHRTASSSSAPRTLIESWNGTSWSVMPSPNRGVGDFLNGASCVPAGTCTTVGYYNDSSGGEKTLIESGTGSG